MNLQTVRQQMKDQLNDPRHILDLVLKRDLSSFVEKVFQTVSPGDRYRSNWHIDAITFELSQIHQGKNRRLIITQPPRSLKSICSSVAFVAWALGENPSLRFACVSYSNELAATLARQFRSVVTSDWYRQLFPGVMLVKDSETESSTSRGGGRIALSIGGTFTGRGADIIIVDDPMKAEDAQSDKARKFVSNWYQSTLVSRLNDKREGAIILVMQRLHEDDLAGKLLIGKGWRLLDLPAIAVADQMIRISPGKVYHRREGEVLHPDRESRVDLDQLKRDMGSLAFSAQYQQRPVPLEGNLIRRDWLHYYDQLPVLGPGWQTVLSVDVASTTTDTADWTVVTIWLMYKRKYFLVNVWRGRLEYPDVKRKLIALARKHQPIVILVEKAGLGMGLIQEFKSDPVRGVPIPKGITPVGSKVVRLEAQSARFEAGQVFLPREAPWLDVLLNELLAFPNSRHDDQVDSISQFLAWAENSVSRRHSVPIAPEFIYD